MSFPQKRESILKLMPQTSPKIRFASPFTITIAGQGGQGIKLLGTLLAQIFHHLKKEVSVLYEYDAIVRGGCILAFITLADKPIASPIVEKADLMIKLFHKNGGFTGQKMLIDQSLAPKGIPFTQTARQKFGHLMFTNSLVLGKILQVFQVPPTNLPLKKILPPKFQKENLAAIEYGFKKL